MSDYDERRYLRAFTAVRAAWHGDWPTVAYSLSMVDARPLDALWRSLSAAGQLALHRWAGWEVFAYPSLLLPTGLNWVVTVLTAWVFYRLCWRLLTDVSHRQLWALVAAVLYASLVNTSLYVRHIEPYEGALLLFMALLNWVLQLPPAPATGFWARLGLGAGLLWLTYPGYYAGPVVLVAALLDWQRPGRWALRNWLGMLVLGIGFGLPLLGAELLSRLGGAPPFWAVSYDLSLHILQGDPAEGYTFAFKYLWQVEQALGGLLLLGLALALAQAAAAAGRGGWAALLPRTPRQRVLAAVALLFLAHATAAAVGHRIVWYGRLLHFYLPWLVLAGVAALAQVRQRWAAGVGLAACVVGGLAYGAFYAQYQQVAYAPDVIATYQLACLPPAQVRYYTQVKVADKLLYPLRSPTAPIPAHCPSATAVGDSLTVLVNFAVLYPLTDATRRPAYAPGPGARVLFSNGVHILACDFDGLNPAERAEAARQRFALQLIREPATDANLASALYLHQP